MKTALVIPYYNASKTIFRALASIAMQTNASDITVIIVDDKSTAEEYGELVTISDRFEGAVGGIVLLREEKNVGPGYARQMGVDHACRNGFDAVTFLDADDCLAGPFALPELLDAMGDAPACYGRFIEQTVGNRFVMHGNTEMTWCFAAAFRCDFIVEHGIRFVDSRVCEDCGLNTQVKIHGGADIAFSDNVVCYWMATKNSITRTDPDDYCFRTGFKGYADAVKNAFGQARLYGYDKAFAVEVAVNLLCRMYAYWVTASYGMPEANEENMDACAGYWKEVIRQFIAEITGEMLLRHYKVIAPSLGNSGIPKLTFFEWCEILEKISGGADEQ